MSSGLAGTTVLVTRAPHQVATLRALLEAAGATVLAAPAITIEPPPSWQPLDDALDGLAQFTWVVFTSTNAVQMFERRMRERGMGWHALARARLAAVGAATAAGLAARGVRDVVVPRTQRAEGLVEQLTPLVGPHDRVLLPCAVEALDTVRSGLAASAAAVVVAPAYLTSARHTPDPAVADALAAGAISAVTFTSPSGVRAFAAWRPTLPAARRPCVACIGPVTAAAAAEHGLRAAVIAPIPTLEALVTALSDYFRRTAGAQAGAVR